jgi:hypothetical protein
MKEDPECNGNDTASLGRHEVSLASNTPSTAGILNFAFA